MSETDTEVIANLIDPLRRTDAGRRSDPQDAVGDRGILRAAGRSIPTIRQEPLRRPRTSRRCSSASASRGVTLASDVMALVGYAEQYFPIEDKTFIVVRRKDGINELQRSMTSSDHPVEYQDVMTIDIVLDEIGKGGYQPLHAQGDLRTAVGRPQDHLANISRRPDRIERRDCCS
ncbi:MAG: hypothetical protein MZU97_01375 [Bacillus subtilis]|nr:hypothetical protein [Bacillus subtilis]